MVVVQGSQEVSLHFPGGAVAGKPAGLTLIRCSLKPQMGLSCQEHNTGQAF